jgi:hypothetical protein
MEMSGLLQAAPLLTISTKSPAASYLDSTLSQLLVLTLTSVKKEKIPAKFLPYALLVLQLPGASGSDNEQILVNFLKVPY